MLFLLTLFDTRRDKNVDVLVFFTLWVGSRTIELACFKYCINENLMESSILVKKYI